MSIQIDTARFERIRALTRGSHRSFDDGTCVMEAVSYIAGEKFSDHPECVCPVLGAFMRAWNDGLPTDDDRTRLLRPLITRLVNTRGSKNLERRRAAMAADWLIRVHAPAWLRLANLDRQADELASLPEITDLAQCRSLMPTLTAVRDDAAAAWSATLNAARDAAWVASRDAVWDAAWDAASDAARDAALNAAWDDDTTKALFAALDAARDAGRYAVMNAAWDAARDAAWVASRDAAWDAALNAARDAAWDAALNAALDDDTTKALFAALDAARDAGRYAVMNAVMNAVWDAASDAARDALKPAREMLQRSALDLVERMIAATD